RWEKDPTPEPQAYSPGAEVSKRWNVILEGLGVQRERARPVNRKSDEELSAFLQSLGARTEVVTLLEFLHPPLSARQFADRLKARMYSSEWYIPEDVFAQASLRLDQWLDSECPSPDTPTQEPDTFRVLAASWDR